MFKGSRRYFSEISYCREVRAVSIIRPEADEKRVETRLGGHSLSRQSQGPHWGVGFGDCRENIKKEDPRLYGSSFSQQRAVNESQSACRLIYIPDIILLPDRPLRQKVRGCR